MLQRLLLITLTLCSLSASAQWQQTGSKVRYVNGLGIPTKDTAAGVSADSSQIVIRPADSSLYIKYKRTWIRVGGGGGITNAVTFNNSGSGAASGTSFNGATPVTVSYNTIGAQPLATNLTSLAGLSYASTSFVKMTGAGTFALDNNTYITGNQTITLSGDISGTGTTAITTAIGTNKVTNAMLAQIATASIKGRVTAGTGNVEDLTGTQATTLLDNFTTSLKGLAPASGGGTTNFLRADGTWAAPPAGSGTTNYIAKFTSSTAIGNSQIFDNGTNVGIGTTSPGYKLEVSGNAAFNGNAAVLNANSLEIYSALNANYGTINSVSGNLQFSTNAGSERMRITATGDVGIGTASPSQKLQVAGNVMVSANSNYIFDNLDNADEGALIWRNADASRTTTAQIISISDGTFARKALGFFTKSTADWTTAATERMRITAAGNVGIGYTAPAAKLSVDGTTLINTNTDNGVDKLQVSGSMNVSTLATTNNLSVTTNATVGGSATITGNTQINGLIGVNTTPQTYAIKLQSSGNNIIEFGTQSSTNSSRFLHSSSQPFGTIGNASGAYIPGGSDGDFAIGTPSASNNIIFHINAVERVRINTDGEVLVFSSTDNGAYNLQCNGTGVWGAGAYVNGSDSALKYQIKDIDNALHLVMQLKPKTYKYKPFYNNSTETQTGFIAQDLEKVLKNEIYKDGVVISGGKYKGVAYDALIPLLVKTIQEQQSQIEDIKKQIEELKKLIKQ